MDLRGKGNELNADIREYLQEKISEETFLVKWGQSVLSIVNDSFKPEMSKAIALLTDKADEAKIIATRIGNNISLFCAAFIK